MSDPPRTPLHRRALLVGPPLAVAAVAGAAPAVAAPKRRTWKLGGNEDVATNGSDWIGARNRAPVVFRTTPTNGQPAVERMRITSGGDVGIGTTPNAARLDVRGAGENTIQAVNTRADEGVAVLASSPNGTGVVCAGFDGIFASGEHFAVYAEGDVHCTGTLSKAAGSFRIDHPIDPDNKLLQHSFVESPDMMNVYNGNVVTDADGLATVVLPDYFRALNRDFRYQLTAVGTRAQAWVAREIHGDRFEVRTDRPQVKVSWQVTGIRQDPYARAHRIEVEVDKPAQERGTREFAPPGSEALPAPRPHRPAGSTS